MFRSSAFKIHYLLTDTNGLFFFTDLMFQGKAAPGPRQWPIIGSIPYVAKYRDICDAFTAMRKQYGDVVALKLGGMEAMVFSGVKHQKQILSEKSHLLDARPNFIRHNLLFGGNKNNCEFLFVNYNNICLHLQTGEQRLI